MQQNHEIHIFSERLSNNIEFGIMRYVKIHEDEEQEFLSNLWGKVGQQDCCRSFVDVYASIAPRKPGRPGLLQNDCHVRCHTLCTDITTNAILFWYLIKLHIDLFSSISTLIVIFLCIRLRPPLFVHRADCVDSAARPSSPVTEFSRPELWPNSPVRSLMLASRQL